MSDKSSNIVTLVVGPTPPPRLDKALAEVAPEGLGLSRSQLTRLIEAGAVARANGDVVSVLKTKTFEGEEWTINVPPPVSYDADPEDIPLEIVYEDDDLIVVNKEAGMVVHPAPGSPNGTLVNALMFLCGDSLSGVGGEKRPGIVHRIDKDTSGLLVVAKSDAAHQGLAAQFAKHTIKRRYLAVTRGLPDRAEARLAGLKGVAFETGGVIRIATNIARHKTDRKRMAVAQHEGRHAVTRMAVLDRAENHRAGLIECWLETGRTHQIRVHTAHIGHGLVGDPIYGLRRPVSVQDLNEEDRAYVKSFKRQALHATTLGFIHPITGEELEFSADLPNDMKALCIALGLNARSK
jgi:23S rRNA pseudouridine1911/1915/1917 synthase